MCWLFINEEDMYQFVFQMFVFGKHWSLADGLVSIWCNAICPGLFVAYVITLDLSALIRSNPNMHEMGTEKLLKGC